MVRALHTSTPAATWITASDPPTRNLGRMGKSSSCRKLKRSIIFLCQKPQPHIRQPCLCKPRPSMDDHVISAPHLRSPNPPRLSAKPERGSSISRRAVSGILQHTTATELEQHPISSRRGACAVPLACSKGIRHSGHRPRGLAAAGARTICCPRSWTRSGHWSRRMCGYLLDKARPETAGSSSSLLSRSSWRDEGRVELDASIAADRGGGSSDGAPLVDDLTILRA